MDAKLIVIGGKANKSEVKLKLPTIIGRSRKADLTVAHPKVSRQHCEIFERDGVLFVKDFGSLNGTFIENNRVTETVLKPGDKLTVGPLTFVAVYTAKGPIPTGVAPETDLPTPPLPTHAGSKKGRGAEETLSVGSKSRPKPIVLPPAPVELAAGAAQNEELPPTPTLPTHGAEAPLVPEGAPVGESEDFSWLTGDTETVPSNEAGIEPPASTAYAETVSLARQEFAPSAATPDAEPEVELPLPSVVDELHLPVPGDALQPEEESSAPAPSEEEGFPWFDPGAVPSPAAVADGEVGEEAADQAVADESPVITPTEVAAVALGETIAEQIVEEPAIAEQPIAELDDLLPAAVAPASGTPVAAPTSAAAEEEPQNELPAAAIAAESDDEETAAGDFPDFGSMFEAAPAKPSDASPAVVPRAPAPVAKDAAAPKAAGKGEKPKAWWPFGGKKNAAAKTLEKPASPAAPAQPEAPAAEETVPPAASKSPPPTAAPKPAAAPPPAPAAAASPPAFVMPNFDQSDEEPDAEKASAEGGGEGGDDAFDQFFKSLK